MSWHRRIIAAVGIVALSLVDVGNIGIANGWANLHNGFWGADPSQVFHAGLYTAYGALIALLVWDSK